MDIATLLIQLISGAVGVGNVAVHYEELEPRHRRKLDRRYRRRRRRRSSSRTGLPHRRSRWRVRSGRDPYADCRRRRWRRHPDGDRRRSSQCNGKISHPYSNQLDTIKARRLSPGEPFVFYPRAKIQSGARRRSPDRAADPLERPRHHSGETDRVLNCKAWVRTFMARANQTATLIPQQRNLNRFAPAPRQRRHFQDRELTIATHDKRDATREYPSRSILNYAANLPQRKETSLREVVSLTFAGRRPSAPCRAYRVRFERNPHTLVQLTDARTLNGCDMNENIIATGIGLDEAVAFLRIIELDRTCLAHASSPGAVTALDLRLPRKPSHRPAVSGIGAGTVPCASCRTAPPRRLVERNGSRHRCPP